MKKLTVNKLALTLVAGSLMVISQMTFSHTRLQIPVIDENGAKHGSNYNNQVIGHGCKDASGAATIDTIGTVVVFPDGVDSIITEGEEVSSKTVADFVTNWGSPVQVIQNKDVFKKQAYIKDDLGNSLGYWAGMGRLTAGFKGLIPFRTRGVEINPDSCAKSIKFEIAIADVCAMTTVAGFNDSAVQLWTPAVGSLFDRLDGEGSAASLTVNRTSEMPAACGEGVDVMVTPSAAQLNRDMTIKMKGTQVWPMP